MKIVPLLGAASGSSSIIFPSRTSFNPYDQYEFSHGPFQPRMSFDANMNTFKSYSEDNTGQFNLNSSFSKATPQINSISPYLVRFFHI